MSVPAGSGRRADTRGDGTGAVCCPPGRPAQLAERMNDRCCALGRWGQGELGGLGDEGSAVVGIARNSGVRGSPEGRSNGTWEDWKDNGTKNQQVGRNGP